MLGVGTSGRCLFALWCLTKDILLLFGRDTFPSFLSTKLNLSKQSFSLRVAEGGESSNLILKACFVPRDGSPRHTTRSTFAPLLVSSAMLPPPPPFAAAAAALDLEANILSHLLVLQLHISASSSRCCLPHPPLISRSYHATSRHDRERDPSCTCPEYQCEGRRTAE